jgi:hypothetical protein
VPPTTDSTVEIAKQILGLIGQQDPLAPRDVDDVGRSLRTCSRDQLLGFSRQLGLTGVTKLAKDALAGRIAAALDAARAQSGQHEDGEAAEAAKDLGENPTGSLPAKFDLGPSVGADEKPPTTIPWGYGMDRVTAMAVDPQRLFVYWEVTDGAIAAARKQLGPGGPGAWLDLRVYDITGRLFDGTNAHSYFDHGVDRDTRQWFFEIGKPTSTTCVEIGMRSAEGYFVRIARSGRVDFPRDAVVGAGPVEWLTVRSASGWAGDAVTGGAPIPDGWGRGHGAAPAEGGGWQGWTEGAGFPVPGAAGRTIESAVEWSESRTEHLHYELGGDQWVGPVYRTEWQAGPFSYPVDVPSMLELHESGEVSMRSEDGVVHIVYGPWQVVIRGQGARAERRVLATWEYRRTVEVPGGVERDETVVGSWEPVAPGSSAWRLVGASERRWLGSSEIMGRGGSEVWLMGASERMFRGATERLFKGATERMFRGATERLFKGASERQLGGASERTFAGASRFPAASELRLGASENLQAGRAGDASGASRGAPGGASDAGNVGNGGSLYPRTEG